MGNKMLIDATHPEETRVVVTRGNRVEEFDYESASRKQLRGNIYLAKVARIEPSLQAAFVNYGGNRHGFLAFAEIHPDYYQIPVAVREAIMREEALDRQGRGSNASATENGVESARSEHSEGSSHAQHAQAQPEARSQDGETNPTHVHGEHQFVHGDGVSTQQADLTRSEEYVQQEVSHNPGFQEAALPLEAVLPAVIYEEFSAAVMRGEEARDEIPRHPGDGDEDSEHREEKSHEDGAEAENRLEDASNGEADRGAGASETDEEEGGRWNSRQSPDDGGVISVPESATPAPVEVVGSEDALEELPQRHKRRWRHYKIQEVIKRNQIVLIQVVKEERGTKGAALTTYLSLAGRYTVLMPNTASGGGISRKITVPADRKRLKEIAQELEVPEGMGLIIRTAGASRTKAEIKRDFEYLLRLWENVRDLTLKSTAPCLVYEEGDLIKRSIRDLYNKEIDEILVAGDDAYRDAKEFMRMLMPSHAKNVQLYKEPEPLFTKFEVERQLNQMFSPVVTLRSGGYIVLNQTEALVAIDVNSGRATREYSIEDTALKTNMEAAEEVARQVRLRDLAGLIVIDFIDMDERRNNRSVERKLKECLRHDRARIQVGHISHFGLLEMSRQRLRQGVVEVSTMPCPVCQGVGHIRSTESVALMILRSIEDHLRTQGAANITARAAPEAALYILNHKRAYLRDIEMRYGVTVVVHMDEKTHGANFTLERGSEASPPPVLEVKAPVQMEHAHVNGAAIEEEPVAEGEERRSQRRKRRRRRGRGDGVPGGALHANGAALSDEAETQDEGDDDEDEKFDEAPVSAVPAPQVNGEASQQNGAETESEAQFRRNRRRGRRGGRRHRGDLGSDFASAQPADRIPGLGEQPAVNFDHDFPVQKAISAAPLSVKEQAGERLMFQPPVAPVEAQAREASAHDTLRDEPLPLVIESDAPANVPAEVLVSEMSLREAPPTPPTVESEEAAKPEPVAVSSEPPMAPAPLPKPKPVRTGPPRKGWWQRQIGS